MSPQFRSWLASGIVLLFLAAICCLIVAAIAAVPGYKWLAGLLAVTLSIAFRILGSMMGRITIGGK
jgi:hypothetical protein